MTDSARSELLDRCAGAFCGNYVDLRAENRRLEWDNSTLRTGRDAAIASATLGLAQTLRLIRDMCPGAASSMAAGALERAGIEDPEEDCDAF